MELSARLMLASDMGCMSLVRPGVFIQYFFFFLDDCLVIKVADQGFR